MINTDSYGPSGSDPKLPAVLRLLEGGRPMLFWARISSSDGVDAIAASIDDLHGNLRQTVPMGLPDIRPSLPPDETLRRGLASARRHKSRRLDGTFFFNRFFVIDLLDEANAVAILSCGTARSLTDDDDQPACQFLADAIRTYEPAVVAAKRVDRITRRTGSLGVVTNAAEQRGTYILDEERFYDLTTDLVQLTLKVEHGAQHARMLPGQLATGAVIKTDTEFENHHARVGLPWYPPPGLLRVRMKDGTTTGDSYWYFDAPQWYPPENRVASGLPEGPARRDQVAAVRFFLRNFGKPRYGHKEMAAALRARCFSSDPLRAKRKDASACYGEESPSANMMRHLIVHLPFFQTGRIALRAVALDQTVELSGGFPPDGEPWAEPEDFERITRYLAKTKADQARRHVMALSGVAVTVNGQPAVLHKSWQVGVKTSDRYGAMVHDRSGKPRRNAFPGWFFSHREITRILIEAVMAARSESITLVDLAGLAKSPEVEAIEAEQATIAGELVTLQTQQQRLLDHLTAEDADTEFSKALRRDVMKKHQHLETQGSALRRRLETNSAKIDELTDGGRGGLSPRLDDLVELVDSLRRPSDTSFGRFWRATFRDFDITTRDISPGPRYPARHIAISGRMVFASKEGDVEIPFAGEWEAWRDQLVEGRMREVIDGLAKGTPYAELMHRDDRFRDLMHFILGHTNRRYEARSLLKCTDPDIQRVAFAFHFAQEPKSCEAIADEFGMELAWVRRVVEVWATRPSGLFVRHKTPARAIRCLELIAEWGGEVPMSAFKPDHTTQDRHNLRVDLSRYGIAFTPWDRVTNNAMFSMAPCAYCGGFDFTLSTIYEPVVMICRNCRIDRAGLSWPEDPYGRYDYRLDRFGSRS